MDLIINGFDNKGVTMIKKIILMILMFLIFGTMNACQTTSESSELNLVISGLAQPQEKTFFRTFVKLFEAETGISVNLSYVTPADLITQIGGEIQSSQIQSDVIMVDTANMKYYVEGGLMIDLGELVNSFSDRTIINLFNDSTSKDGKTYFVPVSFDTYISIFNKEALPYIPDTVEVVRNSEDEITEIISITWEEFANWSASIREETGIPKTGFPMGLSNSQLLYPMGGMALAFGATSFPDINDSGAMEAWNLIAGMAADGSIVDESILSTVNQPDSLLTSGILWLSFGHMGPIGSAYGANPDLYVLGPAPISEATQTAGTTAGAWALGIVKGSPHQDASAAWIEFMTEPEINYLYCSGLGGVISPIEEVQNELGTSSTDQVMAVGLASYQGAVRIAVLDTSRYSSWQSVKAIYIALYQRLLNGVALEQEEADIFQSQIDALLQNDD